ncbi:hypothetical protein HanRHA438_Chr16g0761161 [Helianthus annuus]|nr:hypothetical protein HanRHA438_Chr16g0761161 [Helianthus annuus]
MTESRDREVGVVCVSDSRRRRGGGGGVFELSVELERGDEGMDLGTCFSIFVLCVVLRERGRDLFFLYVFVVNESNLGATPSFIEFSC